LGPCERAPQMSSQSVQTFLQGSVVSNRQTHRQCHTTTSVLSVWANSSEILLVLYSAFHNSHDHFSVVSSFVCVWYCVFVRWMVFMLGTLLCKPPHRMGTSKSSRYSWNMTSTWKLRWSVVGWCVSKLLLTKYGSTLIGVLPILHHWLFTASNSV